MFFRWRMNKSHLLFSYTLAWSSGLDWTFSGVSNTTMAPSQSKPCPLLDLPAELRNRIYEHALATGPTHGRQDLPISEGRHNEPGLLRACRQTRQEATPIFYHRWEAFNLFVTDGRFEPQLQHWVWTKVDPDKLRVDYHGQLDWEDLTV